MDLYGTGLREMKRKKTEFQVNRRTQAEINRENRDGND